LKLESELRLEAIDTFEAYARTKATPTVYHELYKLHSQLHDDTKAQAALERGVMEREPESIVIRVVWVTIAFSARGCSQLSSHFACLGCPENC
jgi:hypothetical protein